MPPQKPDARPVGRPKLHDAAKSSTVLVRFNARDHKLLEAAAKANQQSLSDWVRQAAHESLRRTLVKTNAKEGSRSNAARQIRRNLRDAELRGGTRG